MWAPMSHFILRSFRRLGPALAGIKLALFKDRSFQTHSLIIGPLLGVIAYLYWPLSEAELMALVFGFCLLLITELQNSSLETALNHLHPHRHDRIGASKDMAAGSVLIAFLFLLFVLLIIVF